MIPTEEEVATFRIGGHNAEGLAARLFAHRTGVTVDEARTILEAAMDCAFEGCDRESAGSDGLCSGHLSQRSRGEDLRPLKYRRGQGEGAKIRFTAPAELKEGAEQDAEREGVEPSEWWRRAGRERLDKRKVSK